MGRPTFPLLRAILALGMVLVPMASVGLVDGRFDNFVPRFQEVLAMPAGDNGSDNGGDNGSNDNGNSNDNIAPTPIPTNTPLPTSTTVPTATLIPTPTLTPTPPPICTPRPSVVVAAAADGAGRLQVTLTTNGVNNRLAQLQFQASTNALIDIRDRSGAQGPFTIELPDQPQQLTFFVRRASAGSAATVPLIVVDGCGQWPTLVGGGPSAF